MTDTYPIRCRIRAAKKGVTRVDIYDDIGDSGSFWAPPGLTAQDFVAQITGIHGDLEIHINSSGGNVFEGIAISNAISGFKGGVTTMVDGIAASIASIIVQSGRHRVMQAGSMLMIHDAFGGCVGNEGAMRSMADTLSKVSDNLADIYAARSKRGTPETWRDAMREETWYTAEEAVVAGLADAIGEAQAQLPEGLEVAAFSKVPDRIAARLVSMSQLRAQNKALSVHHTATSDKPWDAGRARKGFPNEASVLRYCHAWEDSAVTGDGVEDKKSHYKFPHHMTDGGPAFLSACRNGLARLANSGIPDGDKSGVEAHLRAHLKDAGSDEAKNELAYFVENYGKAARKRESRRLAIVDKLPTLRPDAAVWNATRAIKAARKSSDPEAYFAAICAGRRAGDPNSEESWALPYRYTPTSKPNVHAIREGLARVAVEPDLTNREQAREFLGNLMQQIDPTYTANIDAIDYALLGNALAQGLRGA